MKNKLNIGMIGMGFISEVHTKAFLKRNDVVIKAISDVNQSQMLRKAKQLGINETYPDYHYMLKDKDIDVIDIMTPHSLHKTHVCDALLSGKTVICEKPITTNLKDIEEIIKVSEKTKKMVYIKQYLRYSKVLAKFEEKITNGTIGTPYLAQCLFTGNATDKFNNPYTWRGDKAGEGGGVFVDIAVHMLDRLQPIIGSPKTIYGQIKKVASKLPQKGEDVATAMMEFPNNLLSTFTMTQSDPGFGFRWEVRIFGTKGIICVSDEGKVLKRVQVIKDNKIVYELEEKNWWEDCNIRALDDIVNRIHKHQKPLVELNNAKIVINTIESFYKSSQKNEVLSLK